MLKTCVFTPQKTYRVAEIRAAIITVGNQIIRYYREYVTVYLPTVKYYPCVDHVVFPNRRIILYTICFFCVYVFRVLCESSALSFSTILMYDFTVYHIYEHYMWQFFRLQSAFTLFWRTRRPFGCLCSPHTFFACHLLNWENNFFLTRNFQINYLPSCIFVYLKIAKKRRTFRCKRMLRYLLRLVVFFSYFETILLFKNLINDVQQLRF